MKSNVNRDDPFNNFISLYTYHRHTCNLPYICPVLGSMSGDTVIGSNEYYYFFKELTSRKKGQNIGQMS